MEKEIYHDQSSNYGFSISFDIFADADLEEELIENLDIELKKSFEKWLFVAKDRGAKFKNIRWE